MDIATIRAVDAADAEGVWVDGLPGLGDVRLLVRPAASPRILREVGMLSRAATAEDRDESGMLTAEADARIDRDVMLSAVLLGWDRLTDKGVPIAFSRQHAEEFLAVETFASAVRIATIRAAAKTKKIAEDLEKN